MADSLLSDAPRVQRRRLSTSEYHRMAEVGILKEDDRVELIEGELVAMTPIGTRHAGTLARLIRLFIPVIGNSTVLWPQNPVRLDRRNEPQPDLALLLPRKDDYRTRIPGPSDVLLLIEVADSTVEYDRKVKMPLYARSGIVESWLVDLDEGVVEVHRDPQEGRYTSVTEHGPGQTLSPERLPGLALDLTELFD
jgi:Uma2 family endonuclease